MRISIIGCGYVGLVTGGCLADMGHDVMCTDSDPARIATDMYAVRAPIRRRLALPIGLGHGVYPCRL